MYYFEAEFLLQATIRLRAFLAPRAIVFPIINTQKPSNLCLRPSPISRHNVYTEFQNNMGEKPGYLSRLTFVHYLEGLNWNSKRVRLPRFTCPSLPLSPSLINTQKPSNLCSKSPKPSPFLGTPI